MVEPSQGYDPIIIAIDAMDFSDEYDSRNSFRKQLKQSSLERELGKAFTGFSAFTSTNIDTGHWGCGAFCGNRYLKCLLQWLAASASSNRLHYFCHGDERFYKACVPLISRICSETTPAKLWSSLKSLEFETENSLDEGNFLEILNKKLFI